MKARIAVVIGVLLVLIGIVVYAVYHNRTDQRQADLLRQLQGNLTQKEAAFEAANSALGLAQSKIVDQATLQRQYDDLHSSSDAEVRRLTDALAQFQKKNNARVDSVSQANFNLHETDAHGHSTATVEPSSETTQGQGTQTGGTVTGGSTPVPDPTLVIPYHYADEWGQVVLKDKLHIDTHTKIVTTDGGDLTLNLQFRYLGVVLRQNDGNLKAQSHLLQRVVPDGKGGWTTVGTAEVVDATYNYVPDPGMAKPSHPPFWDPHLIAEAGIAVTVAPPDAHLTGAVGATLLRVWDFGLAAVAYSDFKTLPGTGLAAQAYWRPSLHGESFNFGLAGGAGFGADLAVHPYVGVIFILWPGH